MNQPVAAHSNLSQKLHETPSFVLPDAHSVLTEADWQKLGWALKELQFKHGSSREGEYRIFRFSTFDQTGSKPSSSTIGGSSPSEIAVREVLSTPRMLQLFRSLGGEKAQLRAAYVLKLPKGGVLYPPQRIWTASGSGAYVPGADYQRTTITLQPASDYQGGQVIDHARMPGPITEPAVKKAFSHQLPAQSILISNRHIRRQVQNVSSGEQYSLIVCL